MKLLSLAVRNRNNSTNSFFACILWLIPHIAKWKSTLKYQVLSIWCQQILHWIFAVEFSKCCISFLELPNKFGIVSYANITSCWLSIFRKSYSRSVEIIIIITIKRGIVEKIQMLVALRDILQHQNTKLLKG